MIGAVPEPLEIQAGADAGACTLRRLQLRKREVDLGKPYPINWLRNQGIRCAGTSHYLMVDIDFWPSAELHGLLLNLGQKLEKPEGRKFVASWKGVVMVE